MKRRPPGTARESPWYRDPDWFLSIFPAPGRLVGLIVRPPLRRALALGGRLAVLHRGRFGVRHFPLGPALQAVGFHLRPSFWALHSRATVGSNSALLIA